MRIFVSILFFCLALATVETSMAQAGYVKYYDTDSVVIGFIRFVRPVNQEPQLEIWETKNSKKPIRVVMDDISEYSMGKDTFRIIRNFQPFTGKDIFFDIVEAKIVVSGRIELLEIQNPYYRNQQGFGYASGGVAVSVNPFFSKTNKQEIVALHEKRNGYIRMVTEQTDFANDKLMRDVVEDFFPASAIDAFEKEHNKKLTARNLKKFMLEYKAKKLR